jgi:hypothetical protein
MKKIIFILFLLILIIPILSAEDVPPSVNKASAYTLPDISMIGNLVGGLFVNGEDLKNSSVAINDEEIELVIGGNVYPGIKALGVLSATPDSMAIEEGYITVNSLFDFLSINAGRMRINFGRINRLHPHSWLYADTPSVIETFLGEFKGNGIEAGALLPLPFFVQLNIGAWNTDIPEAGAFGLAKEAFTGRFWTSFQTSDSSELEIGLSGASGFGPSFETNHDNAKLLGVDLTFRIWPGAFSRFISQSEILYMRRNLTTEDPENAGQMKDYALDRFGVYSYLGYRYNSYWETGVRFDWSENAEISKTKGSSIGLIITDKLNEMTYIRAQYKYGIENMEHNVFLQLVFGLGPHTHNLE